MLSEICVGRSVSETVGVLVNRPDSLTKYIYRKWSNKRPASKIRPVSNRRPPLNKIVG